MHASAAAIHSAEPVEAGFDAPRRHLDLLALRGRSNEMLMLCVVALALAAAILVPAWQTATATPTAAGLVHQERAAKKADRLRSHAIQRTCSGVTYGYETPKCLVAIADQSGRERIGDVRIITF